MQASLDLGKFPSEEPIGSFYIDIEWVECCSSVSENGLFRKDPSIGELKMFCISILIPVRGSLWLWQCFLVFCDFLPFMLFFFLNEDD